MSSGSESDEEYVPPGEPEQLSEEESADEETDKQYEKEQENKALKRKSKTIDESAKKPKIDDVEETDGAKEDAEPVDEKKREEDLWAMFLEGTDTKPKPKVIEPKKEVPVPEVKSQEPQTSNNKDVTKERKIFEFAGETIVVEDNIIKEKIKTPKAEVSTPIPSPAVKGRSSGGLSNILGQINKKNKLSTLDKSKLDWETFKKQEGVEEEVKNYNKGKHGYLDRKDFLERADHRQFELEREARLTRRSNR